jgi:hypothetical protein
LVLTEGAVLGGGAFSRVIEVIEETTGNTYAMKRMRKQAVVQCPEHVYFEQVGGGGLVAQLSSPPQRSHFPQTHCHALLESCHKLAEVAVPSSYLVTYLILADSVARSPVFLINCVLLCALLLYAARPPAGDHQEHGAPLLHPAVRHLPGQAAPLLPV